MSFFVRGFKMPKACCNCPCNSKGGCMITGEFISAEEMIWRRGKECPFVNVLAEDDVFRRWIPVSERLPEPSIDTWVLGYCPGHDEYRVRSHFDVLHYEKSWWVDIYGHCLGLDYISHWMPLPEGPEDLV